MMLLQFCFERQFYSHLTVRENALYINKIDLNPLTIEVMLV